MLHTSSQSSSSERAQGASGAPGSPDVDPESAAGERHPFLVGLGERVRMRRTAKSMTRKALAVRAGVSERHLANLEHGLGNASVLVLLHVARALECPLAELVGGAPAAGPTGSTGAGGAAGRPALVALIGLRGAGKSTLGAMLADDLGCAFIELSREIERLAGCSIPEVQALYGMSGYRRYERRALETVLQEHGEAVIATPGGLVSEPGSFGLLRERCTTVWLQADPFDHMGRVLAQGDTRPMAASQEAMQDLREILAQRATFYSKADLSLDTSAQSLTHTFALLRARVRAALGWVGEPDGQKLHQSA